MGSYRKSRMRATRFADLIARLLPLLAFPVRAMAQTTGAAPTAAPASPTPWGAIAVVLYRRPSRPRGRT